ncbi:MEDS domain-containing protein [Halorarum halobium]|uniref:MEDS domain-containing protein n=1 Tax=Halorarum halobium TaxID=3075121 RepID=UPI0028B1D4E3|nr:MEDS domain-containing protein [Halobaculum sp. XH14]
MSHNSQSEPTDGDPVGTEPNGPGSPGPARQGHEHGPDGDGGPENHRALIYETRAEQLSAVVPFVRQGLERNERVMYVLDENSRADIVDALARGGVDVDAALESGVLTFHSKADTYGRNDEFDAEEMIEYVDETAREVIHDEGYDRFRITGEMTWALEEDTDTLDRIVEYEGKLNDYFPENPVIGLCQYDRTRFPADLLYDIVRAHPHQVYNATVTQNFAYLPPEEFFAAETPSAGVEEFVDAHLDRVRAHGRLEERERTLSALADSGRDLVHGDTDTIVDRTVTTVDCGLSPSVAAVFSYDEEADELRPERVALSGRADADAVSLPGSYRDLLRNTFEADDARVFSNFQSDDELTELNAVLQSGMAFPLDRYGVMFVGSTRAYAFDEADVEFARTVALSAHTALERAEHERTLERRNEELRHLDGINRTIRRIDQALVRASNREEIERVVCDRLADADSYRFVWIGDRDPLSEHVTPQQWAGDGEQYLDELYSTAGAASGADGSTDDRDVVERPERRAMNSGQACPVPNVLTTTEFDDWRRVALENGFNSAISVPLVYEGTEYGVLNVCAGDANALTEMERTVLEELGATIAYAIDATETRAGLQADRLTEVGLRITDSRSRLLRFADRIGGPLDVETVLPASDDELRLFFTVADVPSETVLSVADESVSVTSARLVADREGASLFEAVFSVDSSVLTTVRSFTGSVTEFTVSTDAVELVVAVPQTADVRSFVDRFREAYPGTAVTSVQWVTERSPTHESFYEEVEDRLTERQLESLRLAYHSGYFEWPRESSAEDVGRSLGVSQPTLSGHLRVGQRKLLSLLFDD